LNKNLGLVVIYANAFIDDLSAIETIAKFSSYLKGIEQDTFNSNFKGLLYNQPSLTKI
jgi:hypothetical protein